MISINLEQPRASTNIRGKKLTLNVVNSLKKNISIVKEEDEDMIQEVNKYLTTY